MKWWCVYEVGGGGGVGWANTDIYTKQVLVFLRIPPVMEASNILSACPIKRTPTPQQLSSRAHHHKKWKTFFFPFGYTVLFMGSNMVALERGEEPWVRSPSRQLWAAIILRRRRLEFMVCVSGEQGGLWLDKSGHFWGFTARPWVPR